MWRKIQGKTPGEPADKSAQNQAPSANVLGANNRIVVAFVGVGYAIGQNHVFGILRSSRQNNVVIGGACDVYELRRREAGRLASLNEPDVHVDYRRLLERKDIDAVVIATHDPLHAQICLDSLDAGKHVYCEQPLTRHLGEAFKVFDKVKSSGRVFQLGSQICSSGAWRECAGLVRSGKIGQLVWGRGAYCRNGGPSCDGLWSIRRESSPATIDWQKWLGPTPQRPFSAGLFHQWRMYSDFSAGLLACQLPRLLHLLMLASGEPQYPVRVNCVTGHRLQVDFFTPQPGSRQVPAHLEFMAEFPSGMVASFVSSWLNGRDFGMSLHGHKATLELNGAGTQVEVIPEKEFADEVQPEMLSGFAPEDIREHERNWFDCIRSGRRPNADIELAIRAQTVLSLAELSDRQRTTCLFDEKTRKITDGAGQEIAPLDYGSS